jgi:phosphonate transport system ATP-binding protein
VIELLGVGVPRPDGRGWLLHRVCTQLGSRDLTAVVSRDPAERLALLDAVTGRRLPDEGRVYIGRAPVTRENSARLRARVGDADPAVAPAESRSVLWNALAARHPGRRALLGFWRFPRRAEREAAVTALDRVGLRAEAAQPAGRLSREARVRLAIARELARRPEHMVVREVDAGLDPGETERVLALLAGIARAERVGIVASVESWLLARNHAHAIAALVGGLLVFDGPPSALTDDLIARRLGPELAHR